jgi:hypothetical protein
MSQGQLHLHVKRHYLARRSSRLGASFWSQETSSTEWGNISDCKRKWGMGMELRRSIWRSLRRSFFFDFWFEMVFFRAWEGKFLGAGVSVCVIPENILTSL